MKRIFIAIVLLLGFSTQGYCVTQWNKAIPAVGDSKSAWPGQVTAQWSILDTLVSQYRQGENLIYKNTTTLTVTSGQIVVSNSGASLRLFLNDTTNTDLTTANLDTGSSFSNSTTYYVYAGTTSGTAASSTYYLSLSSSAPTGPTYYVQLGYFTTNNSGQISNIFNNNQFGGFIGTPSSKTAGVVYQALTDGKIDGNTSKAQNNGFIIYSDNTSTPTTIVQYGFGVWASGAPFSKSNFSFLVSKGNYYQVVGYSGNSPSIDNSAIERLTFTPTSN